MTDLPPQVTGTRVAGDPAVPGDLALLWRIRAGDEGALAALYDRHAGLLYALAMRIVGDRELAQEVIQDTFFRCWSAADQYDPARGRVVAWLIGVTRNRAVDLLRSRPHQARLRERDPLPTPGSEADPGWPDTSEMVALRQTVSAALGALPPAEREAIELAYYGGLTQAEIARRLGAPLGTVKTRMRSGLERLRATLHSLIEPGGEATGYRV